MTPRHVILVLLTTIAWSSGVLARTQDAAPAAAQPTATTPAAQQTQPPAGDRDTTAATPADAREDQPTAPPARRTPRPPAGAPAPDPAPVPPVEPPRDETVTAHPCDGWQRDPMFRLGQDYVIRRGDTVDGAAAVFGDLVVEGHVCGDLSATFGDVRLAQGASVQGTVVVVAGTLTVEPGAVVGGELVLVGGTLVAPPDFRAGRGQIVIGIPLLDQPLRGVAPYLTRGLLLGRLIVPDIAWTWWVVGTLLVVYLLVNLLFPHATWATTKAIVERPLSTFAAGVLVLVLAGPVMTLLAVTVVGIAALPVLIAALVAAWIVGKIAVARWIGQSVFPQEEPGDRLLSTRSFVIGAAVITAAYMMPVLGLIVWGLTGVLGLGAASIAFIRAFRRENPPAPPRVRQEVPPPVAVPPVPPSGSVTPPTTPVDAAADATMHRSAMADAFGVPGFPSGFAAMPSAAGVSTAGVIDPRALLAFPRAEFGVRVASFLLDVLLVSLVGGLLGEMVNAHEPQSFIVLLLLAYYFTFWTLKATTVGGIICQLRVVRVDGQPLRPVDVLVRTFTSVLSVAAFGLGMLWVLYDPERQSWQDKVAGTYVVRVPRNYPL